MMYKIFIALLFSTILAFACEGDCIKCHPTLLKDGKLDKDHKILNNCKKCHYKSVDDMQRMGALCGQDCWDCHSVEKTMQIKNKEHLALDTCIDCHTKLKTNSDNLFLNNCLKDSLKFNDFRETK